MLGTKTRIKTNRDAAGAVKSGTDSYLMDMSTVGFNRSQEIIADEASDTGQLLRSGIPPERLDDGSVVWGYQAPYAEPVDEGQEPHWPPIEPIKGWARRVLGDESAAWAVAAKIAEEGTEPIDFTGRSVQKMNDWARSRDLADYVVERL